MAGDQYIVRSASYAPLSASAPAKIIYAKEIGPRRARIRSSYSYTRVIGKTGY